MTTEELQMLYRKNPEAFNKDELATIPGFTNPNLHHEKPLKYRNKTSYDAEGNFWDSQGERERYSKLQIYQEQGVIRFIDRQVKVDVVECAFWEHEGKFLRPITWTIDFLYYHIEWCCWVAEDWKSEVTRKKDSYRIKRQLFLQRWPSIKFVESGKHKGY